MGVFIPRFVGSLLFFLLLLVVGTLGYQLIEGWGVWDALYMTVITLTAVGYQEVFPLTPAGRWLTMSLLLAG
ncbi:MAG: potassium channel family protein, partial [Gemmatimonadota bacterium]